MQTLSTLIHFLGEALTRRGSGRMALLWSISVSSALASSWAHAGQDSLSSRGRPAAAIQVSYADNFAGVEAMFAVRACAAEDDFGGLEQGRATHSGAPAAFLQERKAKLAGTILVQVIDADGREVARHEGWANVCGFARMAAAFVTSVNANALKASK